ncbi:hypothetical protein RB195_009264 [Necator americanus]|uniref:Uncharacterized protein n=1 Tax=Necator americanus TaxID=51031 RepID=A0ABR1CSK6_NECAM
MDDASYWMLLIFKPRQNAFRLWFGCRRGVRVEIERNDEDDDRDDDDDDEGTMVEVAMVAMGGWVEGWLVG